MNKASINIALRTLAVDAEIFLPHRAENSKLINTRRIAICYEMKSPTL